MMTKADVTVCPGTIADSEIDQAVIGHRRTEDHAWLVGERQGFVYRRGRDAVGYGYVGRSSGPFALLDPADTPAVLAHAERTAAERGDAPFGLDVPAVNRAAVRYLQARLPHRPVRHALPERRAARRVRPLYLHHAHLLYLSDGSQGQGPWASKGCRPSPMRYLDAARKAL
jgi:hypothetical protein